MATNKTSVDNEQLLIAPETTSTKAPSPPPKPHENPSTAAHTCTFNLEHEAREDELLPEVSLGDEGAWPSGAVSEEEKKKRK